MEMKDSEKLILLMLCQISEKLELNTEIDPKFIQSAVLSNNTWAIKWKVGGGIFEGDNPQIVTNVCDTLDMWVFLEKAFEELSSQDRKLVNDGADLKDREPRFDGYDDNHENEYSNVFSFLVDDLGRFGSFKDRLHVNSHAPRVGMYARMLAAFLPIRPELGERSLTSDELIDIFRARRAGDNL